MHSDEFEEAAQAMCKLCEKLNDPILERKTVPSLGAWWGKGSHCKKGWEGQDGAKDNHDIK